MGGIEIRASRAPIEIMDSPGSTPRPGWRGLMRTGIRERCSDERPLEKPTFRLAWTESGPSRRAQVLRFARLCHHGIYPWR